MSNRHSRNDVHPSMEEQHPIFNGNGDSTVESLVPSGKRTGAHVSGKKTSPTRAVSDKDARSHALQQMTFTYVLLVTSLCLGTTLYYTVTRTPSKIPNAYELLFIVLFVLAIVDVIFLFTYVKKKRSQTQRRESIFVELDTVGTRLANNPQTEPVVQQYPCIAFNGEGFNLFLRMGLVLFTLFGVIYNIIRIISQLTNKFEECGSVTYILLCVLQAAFLCCQTTFIMKNHKIVFLTDKPLIRLCLAHLMLVNICIWIHSGIGEISEGVIEALSEGREGKNESECGEAETLAAQSRAYLLPALIEYSLLGAPMIFELFHSVGNLHLVQKQEEEHEQPLKFPRFHKAKRGVAFGSIAVILCVISIVCFYVLHGNSSIVGLSLFHFEDTVLNILILVFGVFAYMNLRQLKFRREAEGSVDENILWLSYFGMVFYHVIIMSKSVDTLFGPEEMESVTRAFITLEILMSFLTVLSSTFQCIVIINAMHRMPEHENHVEKKPGRPYITILLFINFSLWILDTFEVKKTELAFSATNHNSFTHEGIDVKTSVALLHIALPLVILFRFHSSVCLSCIWNKSYSMD